MRNKSMIIWFVLLFILFIVLLSSTYQIRETEQVIITQFGRPVGNPIDAPGLHFKLPFIQEANFFEKRFLEWDGDANQVPTKDKRFIWVNTYARWRISDPLLFFQRLRDELGAQSRLDDILDGETRTAIANHYLDEVVRSTNRTPVIDESLVTKDEIDTLRPIQTGREKITREILATAGERVADLGIEILDLRFKRINYIEEDRIKVYDRMITERQRIAAKFRSEGQGQASKILGQKERELKRVISEAQRRSFEIRGEADALATRIYANAYNRSAETREFYSFLKTMETYESTFGAEDWLILSSDSDFYRYLKTNTGR